METTETEMYTNNFQYISILLSRMRQHEIFLKRRKELKEQRLITMGKLTSLGLNLGFNGSWIKPNTTSSPLHNLTSGCVCNANYSNA